MSERPKSERKQATADDGDVLRRPLPRPAFSIGELREAMAEVESFVHDFLRQDVDYGVIPGTGDKPTLLKPGAEKLSAAFNLRPEYEVLISDANHFAEVEWTKRRRDWRSGRWNETTGTSLGVYRYVVRCRLHNRDSGQVEGEGIGSASSLESKYIDRPREMDNTLLKQAKKRAFVDAVLTATALSGTFTQDVEDLRGSEDEQVQARVSTGRRAGRRGAAAEREPDRGAARAPERSEERGADKGFDGNVGQFISELVKGYRAAENAEALQAVEARYQEHSDALSEAQRRPIEVVRTETHERLGLPDGAAQTS